MLLLGALAAPCASWCAPAQERTLAQRLLEPGALVGGVSRRVSASEAWLEAWLGLLGLLGLLEAGPGPLAVLAAALAAAPQLAAAPPLLSSHRRCTASALRVRTCVRAQCTCYGVQ